MKILSLLKSIFKNKPEKQKESKEIPLERKDTLRKSLKRTLSMRKKPEPEAQDVNIIYGFQLMMSDNKDLEKN